MPGEFNRILFGMRTGGPELPLRLYPCEFYLRILGF